MPKAVAYVVIVKNEKHEIVGVLGPFESRDRAQGFTNERNDEQPRTEMIGEVHAMYSPGITARSPAPNPPPTRGNA